MIEYRVVKETLYGEEIGWYSTYGVAVCEMQREVMRVSDVSLHLEHVEYLIERWNRCQLSPLHLMDVISDSNIVP